MTTEKKHGMRLPPLACEITAHGVGAVRLHGRTGEPGAVGRYPLASGVVTPSLTSQNVQDGKALREAIEQAVAAAGGRGEDLIAVLPDPAVRVTLLDFDALPERRQEADAAVRFRLRKSLPFDVEKAALSFDAQRTPRGLRVAAAIVLRSVLDEYESAFRAAGCSPGVVLPSSLAALGAVGDLRPTMMLKVGEEATSVAVASSGHLLLYRLLDGTGSNGGVVERLAEEIYPALVYFEDTYGLSVEQILVSGVVELSALGAMLAEQTGVPVGALIGVGAAGDESANEFAGAIGALL
jgi:type IV pilus assembly protein PilM